MVGFNTSHVWQQRSNVGRSPRSASVTVGLPLAGLYFLYRNRHRLDTLPVRARYGLFFGGYKSNRYYWEIFLIVRKVSVIAISSFGASNVIVETAAIR